MRNLVLAGMLAIGAPAVAQAASFDLFADFGSSAFSYGAGNYGLSTPTFAEFPFTYANCFNVTGLTCKTSGPDGDVSGSSNLPGVGFGTGAGSFLTVNLPADMLWTHPANGGGVTDAVLRFKAPTTGVYHLTGVFSRLDNMTSGSNDPGNNGVSVAIFATIGGLTAPIFQSDGLLGSGITEGTKVTYDQNVTLNADDFLSYVVGNNHVYYNDSTGLAGTISTLAARGVAPVPEPASWALMVGGFGLLGFGMRTSRRKATFA